MLTFLKFSYKYELKAEGIVFLKANLLLWKAHWSHRFIHCTTPCSPGRTLLLPWARLEEVVCHGDGLDSGSLIDHSTLATGFEPFFRLTALLSSSYHRTGAGIGASFSSAKIEIAGSKAWHGIAIEQGNIGFSGHDRIYIDAQYG